MLLTSEPSVLKSVPSTRPSCPKEEKENIMVKFKFKVPYSKGGFGAFLGGWGGPICFKISDPKQNDISKHCTKS